MERIFAMGGGGFSMTEDLALDRYFFGLAAKSKPRVCFVGTASGDSDGYLEKFYSAMEHHDVDASHLSLFRPSTLDFVDFLSEKDVVYVGGGNTLNLMVLWREWELDIALRSAMRSGTILGGISAGAICWFESGVTDSKSPPGSFDLHAMQCLGWLGGSCCPHYDGEENRVPEYRRLLESEELTQGYAIDDDVGLLFEDGELVQVVSARKSARAYEVSKGAQTPLQSTIDL